MIEVLHISVKYSFIIGMTWLPSICGHKSALLWALQDHLKPATLKMLKLFCQGIILENFFFTTARCSHFLLLWIGFNIHNTDCLLYVNFLLVRPWKELVEALKLTTTTLFWASLCLLQRWFRVSRNVSRQVKHVSDVLNLVASNFINKFLKLKPGANRTPNTVWSFGTDKK